MDNAVKLKIAFEISQIDELIEKSSVLLQKCILQEPDFIELNAAGAILHSYYNGLENIFLLIRKNIDKTVLSSERWHSELLKSMFAATEARRPLFEKKLYDQLVDYMGFRHFFRHAYGYHLRWDLIKPLFTNIEENWYTVKTNIETLIIEA